jgi:Homeodomain-like domain
VYTSGLPDEGGTGDRSGDCAGCGAPSGHHSPRAGGDRQRRAHVPVLRDLPDAVLPVAPPVRRARPRGLRPRSRRPRTTPNATDGEVVGKIVYLRQHYDFGPRKIAMYLKRYHEVEVSPSGVWRLEAPGDEPAARLTALPPARRPLEAVREAAAGPPGAGGVKFIAPLKDSRKKHDQFTAFDDCTRIRVLRIYDRLSQQGAIRFLDYVVE